MNFSIIPSRIQIQLIVFNCHAKRRECFNHTSSIKQILIFSLTVQCIKRKDINYNSSIKQGIFLHSGKDIFMYLFCGPCIQIREKATSCIKRPLYHCKRMPFFYAIILYSVLSFSFNKVLLCSSLFTFLI